ncbi:MAG: hypothetical protein NPMRTHETA2_1930003 [Nitrosopumilales archaeon]|nr:MAG: hypothetical protein NPMRTHETA2_1930003 [Nitrosopumilales archaeon]
MSKDTNKSKNKQSSELPDVTKQFLKDNQSSSKTTKSRKKKGGPYSETDRQKRRNEVYRLHFEYGYSALKISELMKINRNTINGDIQYWYSKVVKNWRASSPEFLVIKNIERLELQRTRLSEYLNNTNNLQEKLCIERMILDVESKISHTQLKLCDSMEKEHKLGTKWLNEWMKKNQHNDRYISYGELVRVPSKSYEKILGLMKKY